MHPLRDGAGLAIQKIAQATYEKHLDTRLRFSHLARTMTIEVILRSVLGTTGQEQVERFSSAFSRLLSKSSFLLHFSPALQWNLGAWSPWGRILNARKTVQEIIAEAIADARSSQLDTPLASVVAEASAATDQALGLEALGHQVFTLLSAGHSSTAEALTWAVHHVYARPELLAQLRDEADKTGASPDEVTRRPLLQAVCQEVLRLHPIGPMIGRKLSRALQIGKYTLPAGTVIGLSVSLQHMSGDLFEDPGAFRPARFMEQGSTAQRNVIAFGGGIRHCLGANLGLTEMKLALDVLIRGFDINLAQTKPPRHVMLDAIAGAKGGIPVTIRHRAAGR